MIEFLIKHVGCSFIGTVAFAVLFNVPKQYYIGGGITGTIGWLIYHGVVTAGGSPTLATFCGTAVVVLISRVLAVYMKCPITIFLISGILPLIPGGSVYYTAYYVVVDDLYMAATKGVLAIKLAFAIALGIVFVVSIPKQWFVWERLMKKIYGD